MALRLTWPAIGGPGQIALHGLRFGARGERVTWGGHLLQPVGRPRRLGQFARRHYWLAPRSDDAVGAGFGLRQGAAGLQRFDFGRRCFGPEGRIDGAVGPRDRL